MNFGKIIRSLFLLAFFSIAGLQVSAQGIPLDPIKIRVVPEVPAPDSPVLIELQDATATLRDALITWSLNGEVALSGQARRTFSFRTGKMGETTIVRVRIETGGGPSIEREFVFRPGIVDLIWEADTYTPPFYRGKALTSPGSTLRVFAFTDIRTEGGGRIPDTDLVFEWERDGVKFADRSGVGLSSFSFESSQLKSGEEVAVTILTRDGTRVGRGALFIPSVDPLLRLYERTPLRGIRYERALSSREMAVSEELTLVAEPYFFSAHRRSSSDLLYTWDVNGSPIEEAVGLVTLRNEGEGEASLSVSVQNKVRSRLLQAAEGAFGIVFGEQKSIFSF